MYVMVVGGYVARAGEVPMIKVIIMYTYVYHLIWVRGTSTMNELISKLASIAIHTSTGFLPHKVK